MLRQIIGIFQLLVKAEIRTKEVFLAVLLFLLVDLFIFYFAFSDTEVSVNVLAPSILWLIHTYVVTMVISNLYQKLQQGMFLSGVMMTGCGNTAVFLALMLFSVLLLTFLSGIMFFLFSMFFHWGFGVSQARVFLVFFLSGFGFCSSGILVSELLSHARLKELLLPVIYFPMVLPLLMASVKASIANAAAFEPRSLFFLLGINLILFFSSMLLYDFAKEELA